MSKNRQRTGKYNPPPKETQFPKGVTGNPNGRPKGKLNRSTLFNRWAEVMITTKNPLTEQVEGLTQDDLVILSLLNKARKGDVHAIKEWLDNRFGKLTDKLEVETIDKGKELTKEELKEQLEKMGLNIKLFDK